VLVGREALESLQTPSKVVGINEGLQVLSQLVVAVVVVALDRGFLDRAIHALDLSVGPGMVGLGRSVLDVVGQADSIEHMQAQSRRGAVPSGRQVAELDAVVGEDRVDPVGHGVEQGLQEGGSCLHRGLLFKPREGELGGAVDGSRYLW